MGKNQKIETEETTEVINDVGNTNPPVTDEKSTSYVVVREGYRVSDQEYSTPDDPVAKDERQFWKRVADNFSYGEKVEIVKYDNKKHRIW